MKTQYIIILTTFTLLSACNNQPEKDLLFGKWSCFINDSTYYEIWINDSLILNWNELGWSFDVDTYRLDRDDSSFYRSVDNFKTDYYMFRIKGLTKEQLTISNDKGEWTFVNISNESPMIKRFDEEIRSEISARNTIERLIYKVPKREDVKVKIDSINSGISINLKEIKKIRDSIDVAFDGYFYDIPVTLIHNKIIVFQDILQTDESTGFSTNIKFKRGVTNNFILLLEGKKYEFVEDNEYNFIHISDTKDGFSIVYTNKGYIYD